MNVKDVLVKLMEYVEAGYGDLPVHILDMEAASDDEQTGIVTHIELDMFDEEQGQVVDLVSWPNKDAR